MVAKDIELDAAAGRALCADRPERRRQDHADQSDDRHAQARRRPDFSRRRRHHGARARGAGQARPGAHVPDQHAVPPSQRARGGDARGLRAARLCRHLVAEAAGLWRRDRRGLRDPASRCGSAASCYRPTRELAYGQQRLLEIALALATRPKVLLLDEPAAGVPQDESAELFAVIADLSQDIAVLFIEHDMNVVFRFANRIIVMVGGRILVEGTPSEIAADARVREVYLGERAPWLSRCWRSTTCAPATATRSCSTASRSRSREQRQPRGARAQRRRQDARCCSPSWATPRSRRGTIRLARPRHHARARRIGARATASAGWRRSARFFPRSASRRT